MGDVLLVGQVLDFVGNPMVEGLGAARHRARGGVLLREGLVADVDEAAALRARVPDAEIVDCGAGLILPGFVDAHVHYPQTRIIASWGKRLIDWLEGYTFPEEMRFGDPAYAAAVAGEYLDLALAHGTTSLASYCTIHPESVDALMAAAEARGMRIVAGKVMMDRNAPEGLRDSAKRGYEESRALIARWHGRGRLTYAVTPRFAPTSSPGQLEAAGALWAEHRDCAMQTHLSEQPEEIAWVRDLYPEDADYLAVYERFGLVGRGAVMGHAIHLTEREWAAMGASGAGIAHCPTSNTFIGSGLFDWDSALRHGVPVGLGSDIGGGSNFGMLRTMAAAYEVAQLRGRALHPAELLWLATGGSAEVLGIGDRVGRIAPGMEADLVVLDLASTPAIAQRAAQARDVWEAVFPTIMMGDDRAVAEIWVGGRRTRAGDAVLASRVPTSARAAEQRRPSRRRPASSPLSGAAVDGGGGEVGTAVVRAPAARAPEPDAGGEREAGGGQCHRGDGRGDGGKVVHRPRGDAVAVVHVVGCALVHVVSSFR